MCRRLNPSNGICIATRLRFQSQPLTDTNAQQRAPD
jgi:hypothetical protein